jgi:hypothetical protein
VRHLFAAAALLALAAGCGGGEAGELPPVSGGTSEQGAIVRSIVAGLAPTEIEQVRILAPDPAGTPLGIDAAELRLTRRHNSRRSTRAYWEELLIAGAFRDRSAQEGLMKVIAFEGAEGGASLDLRGREPTSPARPASSAEQMIIARLVAARAEGQGATVERLDIVAPYGPAVVLIVRVDDPAAFLENRFRPMIEGWWVDSRFEGSYILVRGRDGGVVAEFAYSTRLTAASLYFRPDLGAAIRTSTSVRSPQRRPAQPTRPGGPRARSRSCTRAPRS